MQNNESFSAVYLTNFNCGPDSFLLSYADEIMKNQPFLSLQIDEHSADAGYLTRMEAFFDIVNKKHKQLPDKKAPYSLTSDFSKRKVWIPQMHPFGGDLAAAVFRGQGFKAEVLPLENSHSLDLGFMHTRGSECLPTTLTIGSFLKILQSLDSEKQEQQTLFLPTAHGPCRFGQYCHLCRQVLDKCGYNNVAILSPSNRNAYLSIDDQVRKELFKSIICSDLLMKARCRLKPYEVTPGEVDTFCREANQKLKETFENKRDLCQVIHKIFSRAARIPQKKRTKPLVGIVGEIYVRNNQFANEGLITVIEEYGGEAWLTPITEWLMYVSSLRNIRQMRLPMLSTKTWGTMATHAWQRHWEHKLYSATGGLLKDRYEPPINEVMNEGSRYMKINIGGEAILTIGRTVKFAEQQAKMVINCAPFGCMPGTVTTALFQQLSSDLKNADYQYFLRWSNRTE